ncbi:MAG TPA: hypothetical protein VN775_05870 [Opitutaceae bacterium]|nr:hypothetical protein [Opitutaceae bacterium]
MKTRTYLALGLFALCAAGFASQAAAGVFSNDFRMLVVAEQPNAATASQDNPASYIAFDGGYIEAGDPIAGETPPTADQVRQSLRAALAEHGFQPASGTPSIVLTYHWGILRVDHYQIRAPYGIKTNLRARIELVSTEQLGAEVENHILGREKGSGMNEDVSTPKILAGPLETVVQDSRQPRIFVVVTAYDYQALVHHETKVLWRTKLSTLESSGDAQEVIPALLAAGGSYFGKNFPNMQDVEGSLSKTAQPTSGTAYVQPSPDSYQLDKPFIDGLLKREHQKISGLMDDDHS